ncbi:MAG: hypothetical protein U0942_03335 [Parvibaculum sp.]|nr:hypothetical protein [Parvibaculum sp.]
MTVLPGALAMSLWTSGAQAGGWPLEPGTGEVIVSLTRLSADERFGPDGTKRRTSRYTKLEVSPYAEYGATTWLTLIGEAAWARQKTEFFGTEHSDEDFTRLKAGGRISLGDWQKTRFSFQPIATLNLAATSDDPSATRSGDIDLELGLVLARSDTVWNVEMFSVQEIAWNYRDRGRPAEARADVTLGAKPWAGAMLLLKSLNTTALGSAAGGAPYRANKLAVSFVHALPEELAPGISLEAGMERTIAGQNTVHGTTWRLGLWHRF